MIAQATEVIIKSVQREAFNEEFGVIAQSSSKNDGSHGGAKARKRSLKESSVYQLDPYVDDTGILRVGGRLHQTDRPVSTKTTQCSYLKATTCRCYGCAFTTRKYTT